MRKRICGFLTLFASILPVQTAMAQETPADKIKKKVKEFFEGMVQFEARGDVFRIKVINPRDPSLDLEICEAFRGLAEQLRTEVIGGGAAVGVKVDVMIAQVVNPKAKIKLTVEVIVGRSYVDNTPNPNSNQRARDGEDVEMIASKNMRTVFLAVAGNGTSATNTLAGGNGGSAKISQVVRSICIAVGGNGGKSDQSHSGFGGAADSHSGGDDQAVAVSGSGNKTGGPGGQPSGAGKATAESKGLGIVVAWGGRGGDAGPAEGDVGPGQGGRGGDAAAKLKFPAKAVKIGKDTTIGPEAYANGGIGGNGGLGKPGSTTTAGGKGGKGGTSGNSELVFEAGVKLGAGAIKGGTGGKGGTGNPPGAGGDGGAGGKLIENGVEQTQGPTGDTGPQGDLAQ